MGIGFQMFGEVVRFDGCVVGIEKTVHERLQQGWESGGGVGGAGWFEGSGRGGREEKAEAGRNYEIGDGGGCGKLGTTGGCRR